MAELSKRFVKKVALGCNVHVQANVYKRKTASPEAILSLATWHTDTGIF